MKIGLGQHVGMRQDLRVNPRLYQAMDMLYMPMMELQQHLKQEMLVNPFLELMDDEELPAETPATDQEKEKEQQQKDEEMDWEEVLLNGFDVGGTRAQHEVIEYTEPVTVEVRDLIDHLREQLSFMDLTPRQLLLAEEFLGNIQEDGSLATTLEEILRSVNQWLIANAPTDDEEPDPDDVGLDEFGEQEEEPAEQEAAPSGMIGLTIEPITQTVAEGTVTPAEPVEDSTESEEVEPFVEAPLVAPPGVELFTQADMDEMLGIIQQLDPPGVASRDVRECLLLQLAEMGDVDTLSFRLVSDAFEALPGLRSVLVVAGGLYLTWLGVGLVRSAGTSADVGARASGLPSSLLGVAAFQVLNPKGWVLVLTATSALAQDRSFLATLLALSVLFVSVSLFCSSLWACLGALIVTRLEHPRARLWFERAMGSLLIASALLLVL